MYIHASTHRHGLPSKMYLCHCDCFGEALRFVCSDVLIVVRHCLQLYVVVVLMFLGAHFVVMLSLRVASAVVLALTSCK